MVATEEQVMTIEQELKAIGDNGGGKILPSAVVNYARNPDTALHSHFTWDDGAAAQQHRLWQARQVLRVYVKLAVADNKTVSVRAFVSLPSSRNQAGGYQPVLTVLKNDDLRAQMLEMAKGELRTFRNKYKTLSELADVFSAIADIIDA